MTLKELIDALEKAPPDKVVLNGFIHAHSYCVGDGQLAFEPFKNVTVGVMLMESKGALGKTFGGCNGGACTMTDDTPVWLAKFGESGESLGPTLLRYMLVERNEDGSEPKLPAGTFSKP